MKNTTLIKTLVTILVLLIYSLIMTLSVDLMNEPRTVFTAIGFFTSAGVSLGVVQLIYLLWRTK